MKEHNQRLDQLRQSSTSEIAELSAAKLAALTERDEAVNRMTVALQGCRREAYTLRRIASNIVIHSDVDIKGTNVGRSSNGGGGGSESNVKIFNAAGETGTIQHHFFFSICNIVIIFIRFSPQEPSCGRW